MLQKLELTVHEHIILCNEHICFMFLGSVADPEVYIDKIQQDATVCSYLFTANILYMFRVAIAPII